METMTGMDYVTTPLPDDQTVDTAARVSAGIIGAVLFLAVLVAACVIRWKNSAKRKDSVTTVDTESRTDHDMQNELASVRYDMSEEAYPLRKIVPDKFIDEKGCAAKFAVNLHQPLVRLASEVLVDVTRLSLSRVIGKGKNLLRASLSCSCKHTFQLFWFSRKTPLILFSHLLT